MRTLKQEICRRFGHDFGRDSDSWCCVRCGDWHGARLVDVAMRRHAHILTDKEPR